MHFLDLLALIVIAFSLITAMVRGLSAELLSLGSVVAGFFVAVLFHAGPAGVLAQWGLSSAVAGLVAFVALFVLVLAGGGLLARLVDKALRKMHLKWADRLLGGAFGLVRGWLLVVVIFLALSSFLPGSQLLRTSRFAEFFLTGARFLVLFTPRDFRDRFQAGYSELYRYWIQKTREEYGRDN